jgi:hypothetical protein
LVQLGIQLCNLSGVFFFGLLHLLSVLKRKIFGGLLFLLIQLVKGLGVKLHNLRGVFLFGLLHLKVKIFECLLLGLVNLMHGLGIEFLNFSGVFIFGLLHLLSVFQGKIVKLLWICLYAAMNLRSNIAPVTLQLFIFFRNIISALVSELVPDHLHDLGAVL